MRDLSRSRCIVRAESEGQEGEERKMGARTGEPLLSQGILVDSDESDTRNLLTGERSAREDVCNNESRIATLVPLTRPQNLSIHAPKRVYCNTTKQANISAES